MTMAYACIPHSISLKTRELYKQLTVISVPGWASDGDGPFLSTVFVHSESLITSTKVSLGRPVPERDELGTDRKEAPSLAFPAMAQMAHPG